MRKARWAYTAGDYAAAAQLCEQAGSAFVRKGKKTEAGNAFGSAGFILCRHCDKYGTGLDLLNRAARLGYADQQKVSSLRPLIQKGLDRRQIVSFKALAAAVKCNAEPLIVQVWKNNVLDDISWMWFPGVNEQAFRDFMRRAPRLPAGNEMSITRATVKWIKNNFTHGAIRGTTDYNPQSILACAGKREVNCTELAVLCAAILQAHGIPARVVAILTEDYHCGTGRGHWIAEIWSETNDKWIAIDPQNQCGWKRGDSFLNACEMVEAVRIGKMQQIRTIRWANKKYDLQSWSGYFQIAWIYRNQDFFNDWNPLSEVEEVGFIPKLLFQGKPRDKFGHHQTSTGLYPAMNRVRFETAALRHKMHFSLYHTMPFFRRYELSTNGKTWRQCGAAISLKMRTGVNKAYFRGRSWFGDTTAPVAFTWLKA